MPQVVKALESRRGRERRQRGLAYRRALVHARLHWQSCEISSPGIGYSTWAEMEQYRAEYARKHLSTRTVCSCRMCRRNRALARRSSTWQEVKAYISAREQLVEVVSWGTPFICHYKLTRDRRSTPPIRRMRI